ncbi:N-formylglutamate amidohydrolase (plasmid) [Rhodococcus pseudokoreensis]|uniref:N-formylglutamate amidohydrolase n=1 Tax=Rhodococcus pseudokoreensis TaxID=2811421 RepID=A0A974VY00_9NOCA|nr:N-formylglutamate amidohydrolase [Rhodococcus pseudokoreensis]QSE87599.1 N-formylglutamate amidohydrolase [Rhodococcus pseudokoreensis]
MPADPGSVHADSDRALPHLATDDFPADSHTITAVARTGTDIRLQIHTSIASFVAPAAAWFPAATGFTVTVIVHTVDAHTGEPRHLPATEPAEWARTIFSTVDAAQGYFLGAVDPATGVHRDGQLAYRLYLDSNRRAILVPPQIVTCPHYPLPALDGRAEGTIDIDTTT